MGTEMAVKSSCRQRVLWAVVASITGCEYGLWRHVVTSIADAGSRFNANYTAIVLRLRVVWGRLLHGTSFSAPPLASHPVWALCQNH